MAGNGAVYLQVANYPSGIDRSLRSIVLKGNVVPYVSGGAIVEVLSFSITSNVLTINTATNSFTGGGGQTVNLSGFPFAFNYLNGQYTTTSATSTTVVMAKTHADVAPTSAVGIVTVAPTYTTGGLPINGFINFEGKVIPIAGIGPLAVMRWLDAQTLSGSANNYKVDFTVSPPKLLQFSGITQATDAATVPFDTVGFRAEYTNGAF